MSPVANKSLLGYVDIDFILSNSSLEKKYERRIIFEEYPSCFPWIFAVRN